MNSVDDTAEAVGCPIRKSTDQSLLAAPHGLSQRAASFIASQCQGIHQMPFRRLISSAFTPRRTKAPTTGQIATHECATRRGKSARDHRQPARIRQRCIIMTQPAVSPRRRRRPCRVILGHLFTSHVKDPIPAHERIPAVSLVGYLVADLLVSDFCQVTDCHQTSPSLPLSWWRRTGSNRRPHACKARALPTELRPRGGKDQENSGGPGKT